MSSFTIIDESFRQLNKHQQRLNGSYRGSLITGANDNSCSAVVKNSSNHNHYAPMRNNNHQGGSHLQTTVQQPTSATATATATTTGDHYNVGNVVENNDTKSNRPLLPSENRAANLSYAEISQYFSLPMHEAIVQLKVDESSLKKRCRMLGISRWPYRKRMNLLTNKKSDTSANADNSLTYNTRENAEKKKKNSLFECFQVFKLQKKEPPAPQMTEEEHALKQNMMQREYNSRFEPIDSTRERVKRGEYWKHQPNNVVYSSGTSDIISNSLNNSIRSNSRSGGERDNFSSYDPMIMSPILTSPFPAQYQKYSCVKPFSQQERQPLPMQQSHYQNAPLSQYASNVYQTNETDYYGYTEAQQYPYPMSHLQYSLNQKQERLPSIHDLLDSKKRIRRESADRAMQEQFATPMKKFNHSSLYHNSPSTDYHYQALSNPRFSPNNQSMQRIHFN